MGNAQEEALALHAAGYNCAQSVLISAENRTHFTKEEAAAIASGFGGGARCRELCGAISGAVIAFGRVSQRSGRSVSEIAVLQKTFINEFQSRFGALRCADLKSNRIPCDEIIAFSADVLDRLLDE